MIYQSDQLTVKRLDGDIAELNFDLQGESVNKFDNATVTSLTAALDALEAESGIKGLLVTSGKPVFIVGADITEFTSLFGASKEEIKPFTGANNKNFNRIASLPYPSAWPSTASPWAAAWRCCLACDFRVMSTRAKIGLPETKLGILPGWGGTVRLPRIIGVDEAVMWMATGADKRPDDALKAGAVDAVAAPEQLRDVTLATLQSAIDGSWTTQIVARANTAPCP